MTSSDRPLRRPCEDGRHEHRAEVCDAAQVLARFGAALGAGGHGEYWPDERALTQLDDRQRAIYLAAVDLAERAEQMVARLGLELCPDAQLFNW